MAKKEFSRRDFARSGMALTGLGLSLGLGCKTTSDSSDIKTGYPYSQPVPTTRSRKNVFSLDRQSPDIVFYRAAVEAMRQRDTALGNLEGTDPLSWEGQANIHEQSCPRGSEALE